MNAVLKKNENFVFKELCKGTHLSINDIANRLNKSISLTTKTVLEMVEEGFVEEAGIAESSGGRKPTLYKIKADTGYVISMAMDQYVTRIIAMDLTNKPIGLPILANIDISKDSEVVAKIILLVREMLDRKDFSQKKILGIGIAMPGFIDVVEGVNYSFLASPINGVSLQRYLSKALDLPVYIDNDSSVVALAESVFGQARDVDNAMVINVSWGIGLGIVANGRLYRGESGFAGEFSHIPLFNNNKICSCGKVGCLETEASLKIMLENAESAMKDGRPSILSKMFQEEDGLEEKFLKFIKAIDQRDMLAIELLSEIAYSIGRGIAVLIHILNPKKIVLSGRGALAGNVWLPPIQQAINEHCIRRLSENIEIVVSSMGHQAELIGAAALVVENTFRDRQPQIQRDGSFAC